MQSSDRSETPRPHGDWIVSPMASEASTLSTDRYCTVSPPPYTPTESMSQPSRCVDEKHPPKDAGGIYREGNRSRTNLNGFIRDDTTPDRSPSTLPEVVYCELPEVVPDSYPEVVHSTLPQAAGSDLPQVVSGPSHLEYSSLPEATNGMVLGCNMDQETMAIPAPPPTVAPLHLLGDQPDFIDCPFCERQTKTKVKKKPSNATHIQAVLLLMTTVCGAAAPYIGSWSYDIEQFCSECKNRVTYRPQGKEIRVCKQPESEREVSKYAMASRVSIKREA